MSSEWKDAKWGDLVTLEYGKSFRDYRNSTGQYIVYGTNGPIGFHSEALYEKASVIVGRKGAYRGIHYASSPFYVIDTAFYLKPKTKIDMRWAYYQLLTHDINSMDSGSAIPSTSRDAFYKLPVRVPPLEEQKAIANVLSSLDDKIELNRQICKTLEDIAGSLFRSWFIDFDPVKAKATGREPEGLSPEIAGLFPDSFVGSTLGSVPCDWTVGKLNDLVSQIKTSINPLTYPTEEFLHYSLPAFDNNKKPIKEHGASIRSNKTIIPDKCVLLSKLNPEIERVWFLDRDHVIRSLCSTEFLAYEPKEYFSCEYLYCLFKSPSFQSQLKGMVTGTSKSHQRVQPKPILELKCLVPPKYIINAFNAFATDALKKSEENNRQSGILEEIRNKLIHKLISCELTLKKVESNIVY